MIWKTILYGSFFVFTTACVHLNTIKMKPGEQRIGDMFVVLPEPCGEAYWQKSPNRPGTKTEVWTRHNGEEQLLWIGPIKTGNALFDYAKHTPSPKFTDALLGPEWPELLERSFFHLSQGTLRFSEHRITPYHMSGRPAVRFEYIVITGDSQRYIKNAVMTVKQSTFYALVYSALETKQTNQCRKAFMSLSDGLSIL